tara:strand:- start:3117 stop:4034 length:918 start_codon:yes stop_codon:yes gene_type:complete
MTCVLSKAPINIPKESNDLCVEKCSLKFDYGKSSFSIKNSGDYLSLGYDASTTNVKYNANKMEVHEIRIYTPSLHTYDGVRAEAEMIIVHSGFGKNLLVCIPMKSSDGTGSGASTFSQMLTEASARIPNSGDTTTINALTWSLNDFVPNKKPLWSYTSNLPYTPCTGVYDYVVFSLEDYYIPVSPKIVELLQGKNNRKGLITKQQYQIKSGPRIFYNKNGATNSNFSGDDDDIYIECQPTGDQGEALFKQSTSESSDKKSANLDISLDDIIKNPAFEIFIGIVAAYALFKAGEYAYKKFKNSGGD